MMSPKSYMGQSSRGSIFLHSCKFFPLMPDCFTLVTNVRASGKGFPGAACVGSALLFEKGIGQSNVELGKCWGKIPPKCTLEKIVSLWRPGASPKMLCAPESARPVGVRVAP